jgi:hypothetical protein
MIGEVENPRPTRLLSILAMASMTMAAPKSRGDRPFCFVRKDDQEWTLT